MGKKIAVDFTWYYDKAIHAGPKARKDASRTLKSLGYDVHTLFFRMYRSAFKNSRVRNVTLLRLFVSRMLLAGEVLFQYPTVIPQWLLRLLRIQRTRVVYLIHDLERLREGDPDLSRREKRMLAGADVLIVHTQAMGTYLREQGLTGEIRVLTLFDYYTDRATFRMPATTDSIVFCGNLGKSTFLRQLDDSRWTLETHLYGVGLSHKFANRNIHYEGVFSADDPSDIDGAWGLVWDGDSADTCESTAVGRYLKYNSSHKLSLYLVSCKPVIVWSGSSLASWVREHNVGIVVDSLWDIPGKIAAISSEELASMTVRLAKIRELLRGGGFLGSAVMPDKNTLEP